MLLALSLFASSALAYVAPLLTQRETIDRVVDGVEERSYIVMFNDKAPQFEFEANDKLKNWLPAVMPEVNPENVQHVYHIDAGFRGFSVWAAYAALQSIIAYEGVRYVEEDQVMRALAWTDRPDWGQVRASQKGRALATNSAANNYTATPYPDAGASDSTWNFTADVQRGYNPINPGDRVKIWIVDTGIVATHQEFNGRVSTQVDYVTPSNGGVDCNGHGSHCAGSAAGRYRGVAKQANIGSVRVLNCQGSGTNAGVVAGFNYVADQKARAGGAMILSASLGGGASQATDDAINSNANAGVIPVVAAGNDNANACSYSPARATGAITVGATQGIYAGSATTGTDTRATFSNFGTCVQVFAPGVSIHSAWYTSNTAYNTISGTSMATPLAAGAIGLFITRNGPTTTNAQVRSAITQFSASNVVANAGTGSPNVFINANWN
jgi:subtilisin family serine protease